MVKFKSYLFNAFCLVIFLTGCAGDYAPKPHGYFRIALPEKKYHLFNPPNCPYSFEIPDYVIAIPDTNRFAEACWYDLFFKDFNGKIHLSYKTINGNLAQHIENCRTLAYKHTVKADAIEENTIVNETGTAGGLLYSIEGNAASSVQFYITDSIKNFIRGALYFNCPPQSDSLQPVIRFCERDIAHLVKTLKFK